MINFQISSAKISDVEEIFNVKLASWISTYAKSPITKEDIEGRIASNKQRQIENFKKMISEKRIEDTEYPGGIYIAKVEDKIVGYITPMIHNGQNRVGAIYILQQYQGVGIGKALMKKVLELFENGEIFLHVQKENRSAINFYKSLGFTQSKELPTEYLDSEKKKPLNQIEMKRKN